MDYARNSLSGKLKIEDANEQMEYMLAAKKDEDYYLRKDNISFKTSVLFAEIIKNYINYLETEGVSFSDIKYKDFNIISGEEIKSLFYATYSKWPMQHRFNEIFEDIEERIKDIEKPRLQQIEDELEDSDEEFEDIRVASRAKLGRELKELRVQIRRSLSIDPLRSYKELLRNNKLFFKVSKGLTLPSNIRDILRQSSYKLSNNTISYEDVTPLLYINFALGHDKTVSNRNIKYVIIDVAQDYSPFQ